LLIASLCLQLLLLLVAMVGQEGDGGGVGRGLQGQGGRLVWTVWERAVQRRSVHLVVGLTTVRVRIPASAEQQQGSSWPDWGWVEHLIGVLRFFTRQMLNSVWIVPTCCLLVNLREG
jgi:hypothetical protein